jgi:cytochrome c
MNGSSFMLVCALAFATTATLANPGLANRYACVACHQADRKSAGPSWRDVAVKYADGSKTAGELAESIRRGGAGRWGSLPMPAQPALSEADSRTLAEWVLGHAEPKR